MEHNLSTIGGALLQSTIGNFKSIIDTSLMHAPECRLFNNEEQSNTYTVHML